LIFLPSRRFLSLLSASMTYSFSFIFLYTGNPIYFKSKWALTWSLTVWTRSMDTSYSSRADINKYTFNNIFLIFWIILIDVLIFKIIRYPEKSWYFIITVLFSHKQKYLRALILHVSEDFKQIFLSILQFNFGIWQYIF